MKSTFARSLELAKLAAKVGIKELKSGDFNSRVQQAMLIANSLSRMKGAAMKAGQLLSLDLDNYFPPEAIEVLSQLQNAATAHPFQEVEDVIERELRPDLKKSIQSISPHPIGVASIGQVHRARYKDQDIVLKVQYQDVAESIDSDLKILRTLAASFVQVTGRKMNLDPLFQEFRSILEQEVDYSKEAQFQTRFREKIQVLNRNQEILYSVPRVIEEISTAKVLAMTFEKGLSFRQWVATNPSRSEKDQVAKAVLDLYFHEFFEWGLVQTDPNLGNFLVERQNSQLNLCLLDFGATREYSREFIQEYIQLLDLAANQDSKKLRDFAIEIEILDPRESRAAFDAFDSLLRTAIKPFFVGKAGSPYFNFADINHSLESQASAKALSQLLVYSPPPYKIIFLHRKLAGVYSILKSLDVRLDISPYWQMMKELSK